jgi:putative 4-mercaptohistidine N1-methyltranferase
MPWDWPVEVNYHEARAFCVWKAEQTGLSIQLPTEAQWYCLYEFAQLNPLSDTEKANANIHLDYYYSACPVNEFKHGQLFDVIGNVWQWTQTPIYPFEGFKVHPYYDDFTTPTFDEQHNLFKGGSWISCGNEALKSARYAFRRHFFQHAGFRYCIAKPSNNNTVVSRYETDSLLAEYAEFHYGADYFNVENFAKAVADFAIKAIADKPALKALDLGCAVGRSSFELARHFNQVTGIDFSARFINLGVQLAQTGVLRYSVVEEGDIISYKECHLKNLGLSAYAHKVEFIQGDACNLKAIYSEYDLIIAANLIDRLYNPSQFITSIHERLNIGGLLIITSPYTWLEAHTPREQWLGGFKRDGENVTTLSTLKTLLKPHFSLLQAPEKIPFVIRETGNKFQHSLAEATVWQRIV